MPSTAAGAIILRGTFIGGGLLLVERFQGLVVAFGLFLVYSSYTILALDKDDDEDGDVSNNIVVRWAVNTLNATKDFDGGRLFTKRGMDPADARGLLFLGRPTPLLIVLVCIEVSDILFAVDSIPAVFGVTQDPFLAYTSNIFAIIGLRSLYSVLASAVQDLVRCETPSRCPLPVPLLMYAPAPAQEYLETSVAIVLGFVGVKLLGEGAGVHVPTYLSLALITAVLSVGIGLSLVKQQDDLQASLDKQESYSHLARMPEPFAVRVSRGLRDGLGSLWEVLVGINEDDAHQNTAHRLRDGAAPLESSRQEGKSTERR